MQELSSVLKMIEAWQRQGISLWPPLAWPEVAATLGRLGRPLSQDIIGLYCLTGGMSVDEMDDVCLTLWTLNRVISDNSKSPGPYLCFADFLIDSHWYGLKYQNPEKSAVYAYYFGDINAERVADSLDEFFHLLLNDPGKLGLF